MFAEHICAFCQLQNWKAPFDTRICIGNSARIPMQQKCRKQFILQEGWHHKTSRNFEIKKRNVQSAQKNESCRNTSAKIWKTTKKLSTSKIVEISKKLSYTRSYPRYPRKKRGKYRFLWQKMQTNVLWTYDKVAAVGKKNRKSIDISNVKNNQKMT